MAESSFISDPALPATLFLPGLALALGIGLLIGAERGWRMRDEPEGARVAGIRTFAIIGLIGGLIGFEAGGPLRGAALLAGAGTILALLLGYAADMRRDDNISATSTLAAIATLALGAIATAGHMALASVGAGALLILLASRDVLHRAISLTSETDIKALLRLVLVVLVVLPLLPDTALGPYAALNPRRLWTVVVVTVGVSFTGYALVRILGSRRGALVNAAFGAMVSSTAVTLDSARRIRDGVGGRADEAAVAIASMVMMVRGLVLIALLAGFILQSIGWMVAPGVAVAVVAAAILLLRSRDGSSEPRETIVSPPGLGLAFVFAATVAALSLATAWAQARFGGASGAVVIALGGTGDIDSAIAAVGALPRGSLPVEAAALAVAAPILFNTLFKLAILVTVGGWRATARAAAALGATSLVLAVPILIALLKVIP